MSGFHLSYQLRPGVNIDYAKKTLQDQATEGHNLGTSVAGSDTKLAVNRYLQWVNGIGLGLQSIFAEPEVWTRLQGETYWRIRDLTPESLRWQELIYQEAKLQSGRLDDLRHELQALEARLDSKPGRLTIIDTNVLLEHHAPEQVKWPEIVKSTTVRLVIPLRVLEELDEKKYTARDDRASWARRLLSRLWTKLGPVGGEPVDLAEGVTVEVPVSRGLRRRTVDADQEVLDLCEAIRGLGREVVLITGDYGMALRASALEIPVEMMPTKYLRRQLPATGTEVQATLSGGSVT